MSHRVIVCTDPEGLADGSAYAACATAVLVPAAYLGGSAVVESIVPLGVPTAPADLRWHALRNVPSDYNVATWSGTAYQSTSPGVIGSFGDGSPAFDVGDLEAEQVAAAFAAGFVLVALSFAAGKGFQLVLGMLR